MARGSDQANAQANTSVGQNSQLFGQGTGIYNTLAPSLESQAANPQGFGAPTLARMNTEAQESAGGSNAGAVGQGALEESRTRNAGGAGAALAKAARLSSGNLQKATLQTNIANEGLKEQQRETAQRGLEGLYGTDVTGANAAAGEVANNVRSNADQENASWGWARNVLQPVLAAGAKVGTAGLGG